MAIYTDGVHLITDGEITELHKFAEKIGMKRKWFQNHKNHPHYDLLRGRRQKALDNGAILKTSRQLVEITQKDGNKQS